MDLTTLISYKEALELLDTFINFERTTPLSGANGFGTERMAELLKRLDSPHLAAPAIHIAGTKGKGSSAFLAASAISGCGLKTGLYMSPHVETLRERIMINGRPVSESRFAESCQSVLRVAGMMRDEGNAPTYFEVLTAVAFTVFKAAGVEAMVLETGLGGRLDATNLPDLRVVATGITTISLDHENILGSTLEDIAGEKAGIIRQGVPLVVAPQGKKVMGVLLERAEAVGAPVFRVGEDIIATLRKAAAVDRPELGQRVDMGTWRSLYPDVVLALLGDHQLINASLALGLVELFLEGTGMGLMDSLALKRAWRGRTLPARIEVLSKSPWLIVDGAHNPASAWAAAETLEKTFSARDRVLVYGSACDKKYETILRILAPLFSSVVVAPFASPRSVEPAALADFLKKEYPDLKTTVADSPREALALAKEQVAEDGLILVTGSMYLAGEIRAEVEAKKSTRKIFFSS